jgi:hypothetical protein
LDEGEQISVELDTIEHVRSLTLEGDSVSYLRPFFARVHDLASLLAMPAFVGNAVDRP